MTEPSSIQGGDDSRYARLDALEAREEALIKFANCKRQAEADIRARGTDASVAELREARAEQRPIRMGTIGVLILLAHIDRIEGELSLKPLVKP